MKKSKINDLILIYGDLEKTLKVLKQSAERNAETSQINVKKLINRLSRSKKKIERKIGNTILLKNQKFKKRIGDLTSQLTQKN